MGRAEWERYIVETYSAEADHPWARYPGYAVFRHGGNRKWFALVMEVPKAKLGLAEDGALDVMNVKCEPALLGTLWAEAGVFPAYHMSKDNWVTVALDGRAEEELVKLLLDRSFELTRPKRKKRQG